MRRKLFGSRKRVVALATAASVLAIGTAAFAWFSSVGAGTGSGQTGTAASLTISQIGAGYDSLIPANTYPQDQCFACGGPQEFGNEITLSPNNATELISVVVAIDNWGASETNVPVTISIPGQYTPGGATLTATNETNFLPAAINSDTPTETNVTVNFAPQNAYVYPTLVYGITFNTAADEAPVAAADSLNVGLASSATDLSVGKDTAPGTVWMDDTNGNNNDFPSCTTISPTADGAAQTDGGDPLPTSGFEQVTTNCGPSNPANPGAYGTQAEVDAGSADIPAVEFNVTGGSAAVLYPGGPSEPVDFAITNPGNTGVHVNTVTTNIASVTSNDISGDEVCAIGMYGLSTNGTQPSSPAQTVADTLNATVPPGTTVFSPSGTTIYMHDDGMNQDNCENAVVGLSFSSN